VLGVERPTVSPYAKLQPTAGHLPAMRVDFGPKCVRACGAAFSARN
jgi:hypothetical protein